MISSIHGLMGTVGILILTLGPVNGTRAQATPKPGDSTNPTSTRNLKKEVEIKVFLEDKPVAGVTVWVETPSREKDGKTTTIKLPKKETSADGIVRFTLDVQSNSYHLYAKNKTNGLGMTSIVVRDNREYHGNNRILLSLLQTGTASGTLSFDKKPLANAECKLSSFQSALNRNENQDYFVLGTPYSTEFTEVTRSLKTGPDGTFSFQGIPQKQPTYIAISHPDLGKGLLPVTSGQSIETTLYQGANLAISIEGGEKLGPIQGPVCQRIGYKTTHPSGNQRFVYLFTDNELSIFGNLSELPAVFSDLPGEYRVSFPVDPKFPFHFGPSQEVVLESGKTAKIVLKKHPLSYCSGRIVDARTGKGIPDLPIQLKGTKEWITNPMNPDFEDTLQEFTETILIKTDANGKYSSPCKGDHFYLVTFGHDKNGGYNQSDYEFPFWNQELQKRIPKIPHIRIGEKESVEFPEIRLTPSRTITGLVREYSGKPVEPPFQVFCLARHTNNNPKPAQIENGKFTLSQLRPDVPLKVFIRKGKKVNYPYLNLLDKLDAPIDFAISEKNQVSCKGKIVDKDGVPVSQAKVTLVWNTGNYAHFFRNSFNTWQMIKLETVETDEKGNFLVNGLWPGELYYIRVKAVGFEYWAPPNEWEKTNMKTAECEETIDFGTTVIKKIGQANGK